MSESWKRGPDGEPEIGKKVLAWFKRKVRAKLLPPSFEDKASDNLVAQTDSMVEWYAEMPERYMKWVDSDEFQGGRFSNGSWVIDWDILLRDQPEAAAEYRRRKDAARFPTLDDWLRADAAGELEYRGDEGGMAEIPEKVRARVKEAARARLLRRPAVCECGKQFARDRANAKRCPECRVAKKAEREQQIKDRKARLAKWDKQMQQRNRGKQ